MVCVFVRDKQRKASRNRETDRGRERERETTRRCAPLETRFPGAARAFLSLRALHGATGALWTPGKRHVALQ